jgi:hypothetical protein
MDQVRPEEHALAERIAAALRPELEEVIDQKFAAFEEQLNGKMDRKLSAFHEKLIREVKTVVAETMTAHFTHAVA